MVFELDQACDVIQYEGRVFSKELFEMGKRDELPPEAVLPPGVPSDVDCPLFPLTAEEQERSLAGKSAE